MKYVCLLRGINVGGRNKMPMSELRELFEQLNFKNVISYIQSGNLVFETNKTKPATLAKKIKTKIGNDFQIDVPVFVCDAKRFCEVASEHPFEASAKEIKHLHVTFLADRPEVKQIRALSDATKDLADECLLSKQEVYLHCPGGYGNTKLSNDFLERKLGVTATTRNWNSVLKISTLAES